MRVLFLDTETGGTDPSLCGLTEIAAVVCEHSGDWELRVVERFARIVRTSPGLVYYPKALEIQKRTRADLDRDGIKEYQALSDLCGLFRRTFDHGGSYHFYAHNSAFDLRFLQAAFKRNQWEHTPGLIAHCTMTLYKEVCAEEGRPPTPAGLAAICQHYQVSLLAEEQHHASADSLACAYITGHMMRGRLRREMAAEPQQELLAL